MYLTSTRTGLPRITGVIGQRLPRTPTDLPAPSFGVDPSEHAIDPQVERIAGNINHAQDEQRRTQQAYGDAWKGLQGDPGKFANAQRRAGSVLLNRLRGQVSGSLANPDDPNRDQNTVTLSSSEKAKAEQRIAELSSGNYSSVTPEEVQSHVAPDLMSMAKSAVSAVPQVPGEAHSQGRYITEDGQEHSEPTPYFQPGSKESVNASVADRNKATADAIRAKTSAGPKPPAEMNDLQKSQINLNNQRATAATQPKTAKATGLTPAQQLADHAKLVSAAEREYQNFQNPSMLAKPDVKDASAKRLNDLRAEHEAMRKQLTNPAQADKGEVSLPSGQDPTVPPQLRDNFGVINPPADMGEAAAIQADNQSVTQPPPAQPSPTNFSPTTPQKYSKAGASKTPRVPAPIEDQDIARGNAYRQYAEENRSARGDLPYPPAAASNPSLYRSGAGGMAFNPYGKAESTAPAPAPTPAPLTAATDPRNQAAQTQVDQQQQVGLAMLKDPNNHIVASFPDPAGGTMHKLSNGAVVGGRGHLISQAPQQPAVSSNLPVAGVSPQASAQPPITQPTAPQGQQSMFTSKSGRPIRQINGVWHYVE